MVYERQTTLMVRLNNLVLSPEKVDEAIEWIQKGKPTKGYKPYFRKKWKEFSMNKGRLIFTPNNLLVVLPDEKEEILQVLYDGLETGVGKGVTEFYHQVNSRYLGITRNDVQEFLEKQQSFQIARQFHHHINKPILASYPNERWAIDLIDMSRYKNYNRGYEYILSCEDYFSKKIWLRPLREKTSEAVRAALQTIIDEAKTTPKILQKDNGGELQGVVNEWMKEHDIKYINTLSYSPQSNGLIENMNAQVRKILREIAIRKNSLNWVDYLDNVCENKNLSRSSTTKYTPNQLWKSQNTPIIPKTSSAYFTPTSIEQKAALRIKQLAKKKLGKDVPYEVGDLVRVKMTALYSQVRQMVKNHDKKFIVVRYSPDVYRIRSILKKDNAGYENKRYTLEYLSGEPVQTQLKQNNPNAVRQMKRFFASDFLRVDESPQKLIINSKDALKLNKLQNTELPKQIVPPKEPKSPPRLTTPEPIAREMPLPQRQRKPVERLNISHGETKTKRRTAEEWNILLQGKRFTEDDEGNFEILKILRSPDYNNQIVAEIINVKDLKKNGEPKKNAAIYDQSLKELLPLLNP